MKTTRLFLFTMLFVALLGVQPTQLLARDNDDDIYKQFYELQQDYKKLKKEYDQVLQEKQELEKQLKNYQHKNINTPSEKKNEAKENNSLAIDGLLKDANKLLEPTSYSQVELKNLDDLINNFKNAKDGSTKETKNKIDNVLNKLNDLRKEVDTFKQAYNAVDTTFNVNTVNKVMRKIEALKKNHDNNYNKKSGLNRIHSQLQLYNDYNSLCINLLEEINGYFEENKKLSKDALKKKFKGWLSKKETEYNITELKKIPFINKKWEDYKKSLEKDFNNASKITDDLIKQFSNQQ